MAETPVHELVLRDQEGKTDHIAYDLLIAIHVSPGEFVLTELPEEGRLNERLEDGHKDEEDD